MSLNSTLDSIDMDLDTISQASSQPQIFVTKNTVRHQHLNLAQMRGVIQIFNHYFPKNTGKRMSKDEKKLRWNNYKTRIYNEYKRIITGKFASEKCLVKRYSEPLSFIKYKLKRANNLKVSDLSQSDQDYYYEIGGLEDVNELIKLTYNIDSIDKLSNNLNRKRNNNSNISSSSSGIMQRKRRRLNNSNNNNNEMKNNNDDDGDIEFLTSNNNNNVPPAVIFKTEKDEKLNNALTSLNEKLDIFEQEQLEKKKIEIFEITKQKILAMKQSIETHFINDPYLIGCIPSIENQLSLAFDCWINKYKHIIIKDNVISDKLELFIEQLTVLKTDKIEWDTFLSKWKLNRILYNDNFQIIWDKIKNELNYECTTNNQIIPNNVNINDADKDNQKNNSKQQIDCDD